MKRLLISFILTILLTPVFSQTAMDALRYSRIIYGGSARFQGLGGAMGAVGGDFSSISTNPGGLGLYSTSEFSISPVFRWENAEATFNGTTNNESKFNFALGNVGTVLHINLDDNRGSGFKGLNVAFGLTRQNDFNGRVYMAGENNKSSLLTQYVNVLNNTPGGITPQQINYLYPFDIALAYNANLIYLADSNKLKYANDAPNGGLIQDKYVYTSGSMNEFDVAFAANYDDKLYFGGTLGFPFLYYHEASEYREFKNDTAIHYFHSMIFDQYLDTHGSGINFKAGLIYKPVNWVRFGLAIHTPTYYWIMRDTWSSYMYGNLGDVSSYTTYAASPLGQFDYHLTTPFRAIGSVAFLIGSYGLITGEYEFVNYSHASFQESSTNYSDVNLQIKNNYTIPLNIRFGTEWRIDQFRIRGGFGYYGSPYTGKPDMAQIYLWSLGAGYRGRHMFFDATYQWSTETQDYYFYDPTLVDPSSNKYNTNSFTITTGFRF